MFDCSQYPDGYPFFDAGTHASMQCAQPEAFGWSGAVFLVAVAIVGAYILPTVLIGIVAIKFEEATKFADAAANAEAELATVVGKAKRTLPGFFTPGRVEVLRDVFDSMDANSTFGIELAEMLPFYHYSFSKLFNVTLRRDDTEALFLLMDMNRDTCAARSFSLLARDLSCSFIFFFHSFFLSQRDPPLGGPLQVLTSLSLCSSW